MNKETFLTLEISNISQCYIGKNNVCRCGCSGEYTATTYMKNPRNKVNDKLVERRLRRAKKLILEGAKADYENTYINVEIGEDKALTFYTDELN
jgi:hypothetical protein